jgi:HSP20 family protein
MVKLSNRPAIRTFNGLVNELFNDLENTMAPFNATMNGNLPPVNIIETAEGFHAELLAPGRKREKFSMAIEKNQLTISYNDEKTANPSEWKQIRREYNLPNFKRTFNLDENIDSENIQAKYEDGLLKIFLPKRIDLKPVARNIEIQ